MNGKTTTIREIDDLIMHVANRLNFQEWFSIMHGHGWSPDNALPMRFSVEAAEFAVRLEFLECKEAIGSCGYVLYRLTRSGQRHAEAREKIIREQEEYMVECSLEVLALTAR